MIELSRAYECVMRGPVLWSVGQQKWDEHSEERFCVRPRDQEK